VNLEGFSSTSGFDFEFEFFFWWEALRIVRDVEAGIERRVRHIALLCGSKNRGIEVVGGIEDSERLQEGGSVVLFHFSDEAFKILVRRPPPAKLHTASSFRNLPHMWLTAVRLSNNQVFIGPERRSAVAVLPYVRPIPGKLLPTVAVVFPTFKNFSSPKIIKDSNKSHTPPPYSNKRSLAHITLSNSIICSN
jgi:hypothetical protein